MRRARSRRVLAASRLGRERPWRRCRQGRAWQQRRLTVVSTPSARAGAFFGLQNGFSNSNAPPLCKPRYMTWALFTKVKQQSRGGFRVRRRAGGDQRISRQPSCAGRGGREESGSSVHGSLQRRLERARRREPLQFVVAADELGVDKNLRHGRPAGRLLQKLLDRPVPRFAESVQFRYIEAQTTNRRQRADRVLRVGSVRFTEDDASVTQRELFSHQGLWVV